ncbi:TPA: hypothetical protein DDZ06_02290 [Candidatus Uhrbacteria bacterium]|nr:hypothetical protein [Candidatus Uhrbacteria bacterium]
MYRLLSIFHLRMLKTHSSTVYHVVFVLVCGFLFTLFASFVPVGTEWALTGFCDDGCFEKMTKLGFPFVVFHPDGLNSVSWFFSEWAFVANFILFVCVVHTVISLIAYGIKQISQKKI